MTVGMIVEMILIVRTVMVVVAVGMICTLIPAAMGARATAAPPNGGQQLVCMTHPDGGIAVLDVFRSTHPDRRIATVFPDLKPNFKGEAMPTGYCVIHEPANR